MGDSFWDQVLFNHLKNPNHEYYNDRGPLFGAPDKKSEKSDAGTSLPDAVANADPSWFNSDVFAADPSGGTETASLLPLDPPADLGNFASSASDFHNDDLFGPSSDGSSDLGNLAASGDDLANYDLFASSSDGNSNGGNDELFASLDPGTDLAGDNANLFARGRFRRSSRVFRR